MFAEATPKKEEILARATPSIEEMFEAERTAVKVPLDVKV